jgi:chromosome partitioning protein
MPVIVAFISQKGGVGKSTLARALAAMTSSAGYSVVLADLDTLQRTVLLWNQVRVDNGFSPGVSSGRSNQCRRGDGRAQQKNLLILDLPGHVTEGTMSAARAADLIVQPTGPAFR